MGRIPIMTSRRSMQRPSPVMPPAGMGTQVSEAIGGLARTVGKVAEDWATRKAEVEATSEYANNIVLRKQAINNNYLVQAEDATIDSDDLISNFRKSMQEVDGELVWKSKLAQKRFELNKGNLDLAAEHKLNVLGMSRSIGNIKAKRVNGLAVALKNRSIEDGKLIINATSAAYLPEENKADLTKHTHDVKMALGGDALGTNIKDDLSGKEFDGLTKEDKAGLKHAAATIKHNEEVIYEKYIGEQQLKNGYDLFAKSDTEITLQADLTELLEKREISEETARLLIKPQKADAKTDKDVWNEFNNKISKVGNKYKDRIGLLNEIIKSNRVDGTLEFKDAQRLISAITNPPSKSKINDFKVAMDYLKNLGTLDEIQIYDLSRILDEEIREGLTGKAVMDRAMEMGKQIEVTGIDLNPFEFINIFLPKSWEKSLKGEELKKARATWVEEEMKGREIEQLEMREIVTKPKKTKQIFNPEGTGYDAETADEARLESKEGHLPSLDPRTGMVLKARKHPTWDLMVKEETKLGNKIIKKGDRYYSVPETEIKKEAIDYSELSEKELLEKAKVGDMEAIKEAGKRGYIK